MDPRLATLAADRVRALVPANEAFAARYLGPTDAPRAAPRHPVHVVYGGAHLFGAETFAKVGAVARAALERHAPDAASFAEVFGIDAALAEDVYTRVRTKLATEPVEDYRVDFEDGYGVRPDAEEDADAAKVGAALAKAALDRTLPSFSGLRVKSLHAETAPRAARTLAIVLGSLLERAPLPPNFVVTLPKATHPEQVATFAGLLADIEAAHGLPHGAIPMELMIEHVAAVLGPDGTVAVPKLVAASEGRCVAAHFGTYDYTASAGITAAWQRPDHPACDLARGLMQVSLAGTGVRLSDGATTLLPVEPHKAATGQALGEAERAANRASVRHAWRVHADNVRRSLGNGFYQGWDLHPAQLVARYAATYAFFRDAAGPAAKRLANFLDRAAQATRVGAEFDDAATGQGLLETFLRGRACGAYDDADLAAAGLQPGEIGERSFAALVRARAARAGAGPPR